MPTKKSIAKVPRVKKVATDSYSNPPARVGDFTPNLVNAGNYPLIRLTENYPLILSLYRGSWVVRRVIDTVANDMYKEFPVLDSALQPEQISEFNKVIQKTHTIKRLRSAAKWGRLFGGAAAIMVIEGHDDLMEPLDIEKVEVGSYKGIIPLDRWSGIIPGPEIDSNINDPDNFGLPTYYSCIMDAGNVNVHHSRILRFTGRELPQWEVQVELYWGMSEVELIFDELKKRDYSSWNIVSLLTRAQILSISEPQLATLMSGAGGSNTSYNNFITRMEAISQTLNNQGLLILGKDGKLEQSTYSFGGISDVYHEFMKDLSAACEMPYELIFGREGGQGDGGSAMGNNGGGSMQQYDNLIEQKRTSDGNPVIDKLLPVVCMSVFGEVPDDLSYHWTPIRAVSDKERSDLGKSLVESVLMAFNADLITKREARRELANQSGTNGLFSSITPESVASTPDTYASEAGMQNLDPETGMPAQGGQQAGGQEGAEGGAEQSESGEAPQGTPPPQSEGAPQGGPAPQGNFGKRDGEQVPIESKPIGVEGLKWHKSKRITHPEKTLQQGPGKPEGTAGASSSTNPKSLRQSIAHSIKHALKKPKQNADGSRTYDGSGLGMYEPMGKRKDEDEEED